MFPKRYASSTRFLQSRHESAHLLAKGNPKPPENPIADVIECPYTGQSPDGFRGPGRPFFKMDGGLVRRFRRVFWNRLNGCDQVVVAVRVLREHLHDVAIGRAVGEFEDVFARRESLSGNLHRRAELEFCFLIPLIGLCRLRQKRGHGEKTAEQGRVQFECSFSFSPSRGHGCRSVSFTATGLPLPEMNAAGCPKTSL
jgi:hypothetical protein